MYTYGHPAQGGLIAFCPTHKGLILLLKSHSLPFLIAAFMLCRFSGLLQCLLPLSTLQTNNGNKS